MARETDTRNRRRRLLLVAPLTLVYVAVFYLLSYAPCVRYLKDRSQPIRGDELLFGVGLSIDGADLPIYKLIDPLIDATLLEKPLLLWADIWGVGDVFRSARKVRSMLRFWSREWGIELDESTRPYELPRGQVI